MSYLDVKKVNDIEYVSFVKKFRLMGRSFRISEHIGKNISTIDKKEYIRQNLDELTEKEFQLRRPLFEGLDMSYSSDLISEIERLSILLDNLMEAKDNADSVLVEFAKEFIFNSNNIEGSRIPAQEVKKIVESGNSRYRNTNEVREVFNSIEAMEYIRKGFKFNVPSIKRLYYILTKDITMSGGEQYPKGFKEIVNVVNNSPTTPPGDVEPSLERLLENYKKNKKSEYPLKLSFDLHLAYEGIHPFLDGNGRTGRMIMNKILMTNRYFPCIIYSSNAKAYYNAISKGINGNSRAYYHFMLQQTKMTYEYFYDWINRH